MEWKRIAPWNWFKHEESRTPTTRSGFGPEASLDPFVGLRSELERLFDESLRRSSGGRAGDARMPALLRPDVDIAEGKKAYTVKVDLPGVDAEDVSLDMDGRTLSIRAEKRQDSEEEDEGYHCIERSYGAMQRVLSLPEDASADEIEAKFKNGVLKLRIPKHAAPASRGRSIHIESS